MRRKLLIAAAVLLVLLVAFLISVALQPNEFVVTRSMTMAAPPATVFPYVNDFHKWEQWSPWAKLDPNAKNSFEGPSEGKDSKFSWDGNDEVGAGSMTITDSDPDKLVKMDLVFLRPFPCKNVAEFTLEPDAAGTKVTWIMSGQNNFMGKLVGMLMDMDALVGDMFVTGLNNMKRIVETPPADPAPKAAVENSPPSEEPANAERKPE
ncbi:SRPBCC family protein [Planctomicrobium piriforme]|uniref:Polyketide cyclase / dehydrase and lipid transport n=1 Tax=Planctomicrobium piriforme TaxID=1576369 RepID=A0A1I3LNK0_9PLAN|nr:SRPBCC family protein [Planctomicrobium piriforme]SFI86359.1 Polyketide cyclase / dehydrase and lipid transport [Planctomicrobium piriforme]